MTDIVELLNQRAGDEPTQCTHDLLVDAAAEIIRLRATIEQLRSVAGAVNMESPAFSAIKKEIRDVK